RGDEEPIDPAAGHIPTAVNAPFTENLAGDGTFKSPEELARRFEALGVGNGVEVVVSCGSGVTACHDILALHVAGSAKAMLYPGSWSDWSASGYPIATGDEPGTVPHHIA
ncbi:MAG: rhodanese-like domain-containing protein, partial [Acidimicrobiia bacterium]|nr:rhodanese-like domain-containing protein [Acidimicrobiia bacterium]